MLKSDLFPFARLTRPACQWPSLPQMPLLLGPNTPAHSRARFAAKFHLSRRPQRMRSMLPSTQSWFGLSRLVRRHILPSNQLSAKWLSLHGYSIYAIKFVKRPGSIPLIPLLPKLSENSESIGLLLEPALAATALASDVPKYR